MEPFSEASISQVIDDGIDDRVKHGQSVSKPPKISSLLFNILVISVPSIEDISPRGNTLPIDNNDVDQEE